MKVPTKFNSSLWPWSQLSCNKTALEVRRGNPQKPYLEDYQSSEWRQKRPKRDYTLELLGVILGSPTKSKQGLGEVITSRIHCMLSSEQLSEPR